MAANWWVSTQRKHWLFTKEKLADIRASLDAVDAKSVAQFPLPEKRLLNIYFNTRWSPSP
jgi:cyclin-C